MAAHGTSADIRVQLDLGGLGFTVRYPYRFESLPSNGGALISLAGLKHILKGIYGVLMGPVGEDMAHVRIAWGSPLL